MRFHSFKLIRSGSHRKGWECELLHDSSCAGLFLRELDLRVRYSFQEVLAWVENLRRPDEPSAQDILFALFAGLEQHWLEYSLLQASNPQGDFHDCDR